MRGDTLKSLSDIRLAGERIVAITKSMTLEEMRSDWVRQLALERLFEIFGEALVRIRRTEPGVFERVPDAEGIVAMRNFLTHTYDLANPDRLWSAAVEDVPALLAWIAEEVPELRG